VDRYKQITGGDKVNHIFCYWIDPETMEHKPIGILDVEDETDPFDEIERYLVEI